MGKLSKRALVPTSVQAPLTGTDPTTQHKTIIQPIFDAKKKEITTLLEVFSQKIINSLGNSENSNKLKRTIVSDVAPLITNVHKKIDDAVNQLALSLRATTKASLRVTTKTAAKEGDQLEGGKGDDVEYDELNQKQLEMGQKVEMEHTNDPDIAKEIAGDHLAEQLQEGVKKEDQDYYTQLKKIHNDADDGVSVSEDDLDDEIPAFFRKNLDYGSR